MDPPREGDDVPRVGIFVMLEYAAGGDLIHRLKAAAGSITLFPWIDRIRCAMDVAEGMVYIHSQGFLHRDLKSLNILCDQSGRSMIADLGLACSNIRPPANDNDDHHDQQHHSHQHDHQSSSHQHDVGDHDHSHDHAHDHNSHSHDHSSSTSTKGPLRNLREIKKLIEHSSDEFIDPWVKTIAILTFTELAHAEATTHGAESIESVHFHEVGAIDSIVDTVGTLIALHYLNVTSFSCSRLPIGEGTVWTDHGILPVPAPATLRLLVGMPTCPGPLGVVTGELVTPTGAALLRALTLKYPRGIDAKETSTTTPTKNNYKGRPPNFTIRKIGIGAGTKDFEKHPNILRLLLGDDIVT